MPTYFINPRYRRGLKSQSEMILALQKAGWVEDQKAKDIRRWREPKTKALYSIRDAFELTIALRRK